MIKGKRTKLEWWLKNERPLNIMMPIESGRKSPLRRHKDGEWTWDKYNEYKIEHGIEDVAVILIDMCVVDVDDAETAELIEKRFPVLKSVPTEETARGKHYWFARSGIADSESFYNSHGKKEPKIDFKTVHSNGTGGIVVVAPSKGKKWIRPLWTTGLTEIPEELLRAVAVPSRSGASISIKFDEGVSHYVDSLAVSNMKYLEPFLNDEFDTEAVVPVDKRRFDELVRIVDCRDTDDYSDEAFEEMRATADIMLMDRSVLTRSMMCEEIVFRRHMHSMDEAALAAHLLQSRWRTNGCCDESVLVDIPACTYQQIRAANESSWFLRDLQPTYDEGEQTVYEGAQERVESGLPVEVRNLLKEFRGHLVVAGGSVCGAVVEQCTSGNDIDLFVHSAGEDEANEILEKFKEMGTTMCVTGRAHTISILKGDGSDPVVVQLIFKLYKNRAQIVVGFDIPACQALAYYDEAGIVVKATPSFVRSAETLSFFVDFQCWTRSSIHRILKYTAKGYLVAVPGIDRDKKRNPISCVWYRKSMSEKMDASALFLIERMILETRKYARDISPVTAEEAKKYGKAVGERSDYGDYVWAGIIAYVVYSVLGRLSTKRTKPCVSWYKCDGTDRGMSLFSKTSSRIHSIRT